jgi:hypothetical protein
MFETGLKQIVDSFILEESCCMECKKILRIFCFLWKWFAGTVGAVLFLGWVFWYTQPQDLTVNVLLNVTRLGADTSSEYQYHDFYRLQADERFADTVVQWLASPRIVIDIDAEASRRIGGLADNMGSFLTPSARRYHLFKAERLSSQMIEVSFTVPKVVVGINASVAPLDRVRTMALLGVLNQETALLNQGQNEPSWFTLIGNEPVSIDARFGAGFVFLIAGIAGILLGGWVVLVRYYFLGSEQRHEAKNK